MRLAGGWPLPGEPATLEQRMNYQLVDAGVVRQWGEKRAPDAGVWTVVWDLTYRRRPGTR